MSLGLALAVPTTGVAYLVSGVSLSPSRFTAVIMIALGTLWFAATLARNAIVRPRREITVRSPRSATNSAPAPPPTLARASGVIDVSRPVTPWRWMDVLQGAGELLAVAWSVPLVVLLVMVPIGFAAASALWIVRLILRP